MNRTPNQRGVAPKVQKVANDFGTRSEQAWTPLLPLFNAHMLAAIRNDPEQTPVLVLVWQSPAILKQVQGPLLSPLTYWYSSTVYQLEQTPHKEQDLRAVLLMWKARVLSKGCWIWIKESSDKPNGQFITLPCVFPGGSSRNA